MGKDIPKGVRLLTAGTSIRYFGWGLGEAFIPIFILLFSNNFLQSGILASIYDLVFVLSLPFAAYLSDNVKAKKIIIAGLILYIFIGLGYFLAGLTSAVIFLILARALNGVSYSFDQMARETYIMRHVPKNKESWVFGHFDFITSLWWIIGVLIGIVLINYLEMHWLFFCIIPTSIIAMLFISKIKEKEITKKKISFVKNVYLNMFKEIKKFNNSLKYMAVLYFGIGIIASVIYFFTPIIAYSKGESIAQAVTIVLAYSLPYLFASYLGKISDKYKEKIYIFGLFSLILILIGLIYITNYLLILVIAFLASTIFELIYLANYNVLVRISNRAHLGEIDGSLNLIASLGAIIGPITFGFLADKINITNAYFVMIFVTVLLLIFTYSKIKDIRK